MTILNLTKLQKQKARIFIICVVISVLSWGLFAMSSKYLYRVPAAIRYVNVPDNKAFHPLQSDTVNLQIEGSGWQVLFSRLSLQSQNIDIDLSPLRTRDWIVFSSQMGFINRQFGGTQRVVSITPDTLYFDFSKQTVKKVPVKLNSDLSFQKQYNIIDSIRINPAYVTITGPLEDLVQIEEWETDTFRRKDLESDLTGRLSLQQKGKANINVYPTAVEVNVPIGEVTEKVLELPLKVENAERYSSVHLIPSKVKITVLVSLKNYSNITPSSFEAIVDLNNWADNKVNTLPVILTKFPDFCKIVKITPQNIDFIIKK
jgi:YbbR domain-containing protein